MTAVPVIVLVGAAWGLAWDAGGSIRASDWLVYAVPAALLLGVVLIAGGAVVPPRAPLVSAGLLLGFSAWTAISASWSPLPARARDDALLALLYAIVFMIPLVTLRSRRDRASAMAAVVLALGALAVLTAVWLRERGDPELLYFAGRLDFPVTYWNGQAAMALVAFWPAIALTALRDLSPALRAASLGLATAMLCLFLGTQSKGGAVSLAVSAVVVLAVSRERLRLLLPTTVAAALGVFAARPLTEPFRTDDRAFDAAVRHAGTVTLGLALVGTLAGLVYVAADRRIRVPDRLRRWIGRALLAIACLAAVVGIAAFFATVEHPADAAQARWEDFKNIESGESASSHFGALGSNRYDFWRVAWREFEQHPLAGIGGYGWGPAYLIQGVSDETPRRAHSVEFDALSETGLVGLVLLVAAGLVALVAVGRRARESLLAAGALGTATYYAVHTGGDWVWTIPAVGVPAFAIVGIALSADRSTPMPTRLSIPLGLAALAASLILFAPPWLSSRFVERAYDAGDRAAAADDLRWARRLDPLSVDPLLAESTLSPPPANIPPLRRAVAKQPRSSDLRLLLGLALLELERNAEARRELLRAQQLAPRDPAIESALERAG